MVGDYVLGLAGMRVTRAAAHVHADALGPAERQALSPLVHPPLDAEHGAGGEWGALYHPNAGATPTAVNGRGTTEALFGNPAKYYLTWEIDSMDSVDDTWIRMRVRCTYQDNRINTTRGTTVSAYRYRDDAS